MTETGWQPIKTAPKSKRVLLAKPGGIMSLANSEPDRSGGMVWYDQNGRFFYGATHWHPLPDPPGQPSQKEHSMQVASEWQPIDTAQQGERVLVQNASGLVSVASGVVRFGGVMIWLSDEGYQVCDLVHWRPLPG